MLIIRQDFAFIAALTNLDHLGHLVTIKLIRVYTDAHLTVLVIGKLRIDIVLQYVQLVLMLMN
jgi:hypothetical protein